MDALSHDDLVVAGHLSQLTESARHTLRALAQCSSSRARASLVSSLLSSLGTVNRLNDQAAGSKACPAKLAICLGRYRELVVPLIAADPLAAAGADAAAFEQAESELCALVKAHYPQAFSGGGLANPQFHQDQEFTSRKQESA